MKMKQKRNNIFKDTLELWHVSKRVSKKLQNGVNIRRGKRAKVLTSTANRGTIVA